MSNFVLSFCHPSAAAGTQKSSLNSAMTANKKYSDAIGVFFISSVTLFSEPVAASSARLWPGCRPLLHLPLVWR